MRTTTTQAKAQTTATKLPIDLKSIEAGFVFSEESHYVFLGLNGKAYEFKHLESGKVIQLDGHYVSELLTTADLYDETAEVEVGVDDKFWTAKQLEDLKKKGEDIGELREGDLKLKGIRSIWSDIHTTKVFSVCFDKKGKALTKKAFNAAKDKQIADALAKISAGDVTMQDAFKFVQENPINEIEKGEERVLRGYKVQFASTNGFYDVIDMDIEDPEGKGKNLRKVNINEIKWLVIDGIKYVVA
jgi:hypothetical protein